MAWKPATPPLELVLPAAPASQFHPIAVERWARRSGSLIRQALYLDQEDAYAAGEAVPQALFGVGFLARALVQATLPHSDPKTNEFVRRNGHFTLSILAPKDVGLSLGRQPPRSVTSSSVSKPPRATSNSAKSSAGAAPGHSSTASRVTSDAGLPGRPWYRHQIYAPGQYTGYGVKTLPAIREAIEQRHWDEANTQIRQIAALLDAAAQRSKG